MRTLYIAMGVTDISGTQFISLWPLTLNNLIDGWEGVKMLHEQYEGTIMTCYCDTR